MGRLQDKVAVVTGAASGFGRGIAVGFAREGAKVVVSDIHKEPNPGGFESDSDLTTVEAITKAGGQAVYASCDVTDHEQVKSLIRAAVETYGRLDVMVNNAGIYRGGKLFHEFSVEDLDACWNVNV